MAESLLDAITGGLLGVAAGDALGATVEFMQPEEIKHEHGVHREIIGGGGFGWRPGQGTDDTDLTWAVVRGYAETDGVESIHSIAQAFLDWLDTEPRDVGGTTGAALTQLRESGDPITSGLTDENSCGNGSLMRALPTALIRPDAQRRRAESAQISAITHAHRRCVDSCVAYNEIAAALIAGAPASEAITQVQALDLHTDVRSALDVSANTAETDLSTTGYVIDSLRCAVWAIQQPDTLESVLVALVNRGNDADTTAAIAGGLLGIIDGEEGIPQRWTQQLEYATELVEAVVKIETIRDRRPSPQRQHDAATKVHRVNLQPRHGCGLRNVRGMR